MILADTSIWIDQLRNGDALMTSLLEAEQIIMHPFIIGEIALGHLPERALILSNLRRLPNAEVARDDEVLTLINTAPLFGRGIGYVDAHLLASVRLTAGSLLWTRDKRLLAVAEMMGVAAAP